jgi:hypothetical protein
LATAIFRRLRLVIKTSTGTCTRWVSLSHSLNSKSIRHNLSNTNININLNIKLHNSSSSSSNSHNKTCESVAHAATTSITVKPWYNANPAHSTNTQPASTSTLLSANRQATAAFFVKDHLPEPQCGELPTLENWLSDFSHNGPLFLIRSNTWIFYFFAAF